MGAVRVGDLQVAYEVHGEGSPLLLVAGTGYPGGTWWPPLVDLLAERWAVVTYDHRGTGRTHGESGEFSTRTLAADALGLLRALGLGPALVLGHSMGGRVAQWMALDGAEQVEALVLAASGPGPLPGTHGHTLGVPVRAAASMVELGYLEYIRMVQRQTFFTEEFAAAEPATVDWLAEAFWAGRPSLVDYFQHVAARQQHDTVALLPQIQQPTLVLVGAEDTHRRGTGSHLEQSEYLAQALPHATLSVVPGVKHGFLWQEPRESIARIVRWLADTSAPTGPQPAAGDLS